MIHEDATTHGTFPSPEAASKELQAAFEQARKHGTEITLFVLRSECLDRDYGSNTLDLGAQLTDLLAERLKEGLRASEALLQMQHAAEIVLVSPLIAGNAAAAERAGKVLRAVAAPVVIAGETLRVITSLGIAATTHGDAELLLGQARHAANVAKARGGNVYCFHKQDMAIAERPRTSRQARRRRATLGGQASVTYEPLIATRRRAVIGAAALVRWPVAAELAAVAPNAVNGDYDLVAPQTARTLAIACEQMQMWLAMDCAWQTIALHVPPQQRTWTELPDLLVRTLHSTGLDPHFVELDVDESLFVGRGLDIIAQLRRLGVRVVVVSSRPPSLWTQRERLAIDGVKLGRALVGQLVADNDANPTAAELVAFAHARRVPVLAEGVSSRTLLNRLLRLGCDYLHGGVFGPALPGKRFLEHYSTGQ